MRALVVEDSPPMLQLITFALKRIHKMEVTEAEDGVAAIRHLQKNKFDIVVTDINMPVMDGLKLVSMIRQDPTHARTPIIIITTDGASTDRDRAMELGANAYITKPIQSSYLIECVRMLLGTG